MDKNLVEELRKNYEKKGYIFNFFDNVEEAVSKIVEEVPKDKSVAFGGSITLKEIGLYEKLKEAGVNVVWHWQEGHAEPLKEAQNCEYYFSSANAVTINGEILNIDGTGNRVSAINFGHEKVFFVVGTNKIEKDVHAGWKRAREIAAPMNAQRFDIKTPCKTTKKCSDCNSPDRICRIFSMIERAPKKVEMHVIFIDKELGY